MGGVRIEFKPVEPEDLKVGDFITYTEDGDNVFYLHIKEIVENKYGTCVVVLGSYDKYLDDMCDLKRATPVIDEKELNILIAKKFSEHATEENQYDVFGFCETNETLYRNGFNNAVKEIINKLLGNRE